jgi:hypothetical protein
MKIVAVDPGPPSRAHPDASYADEMLKWANAGGMAVAELTPLRFGAFSY